jgi:Predicted RNA-binding protein (contains KH domain)
MTTENTQPTVDIVGLASHLCQMIVRHPDQVNIHQSGGTRSIIVTATVAEDDVGRVIGKQGGTIKAIRYLLEQAGRKQKSKIFFELANKEANRFFQEGQADDDTNATDTEAPTTESDTEADDTTTANE